MQFLNLIFFIYDPKRHKNMLKNTQNTIFICVSRVVPTEKICAWGYVEQTNFKHILLKLVQMLHRIYRL